MTLLNIGEGVVVAIAMALLGVSDHIPCPTSREERELEAYTKIAADYGVEISLQPMEYLTLNDALVQAVELFNAHSLFLHFRQNRFAFRTFLRRGTKCLNCPSLFTAVFPQVGSP